MRTYEVALRCAALRLTLTTMQDGGTVHCSVSWINLLMVVGWRRSGWHEVVFEDRFEAEMLNGTRRVHFLLPGTARPRPLICLRLQAGSE